MNYSKMSKEKLIRELIERDSLVDSLMSENQNQEKLDFAWTNNLGRWYWNVKTNTVKHNPLKVEALGYKMEYIKEEIGYQFFTSRLHPEDYDRVMEVMREHLKGKIPAYEVEYRIKTKNGNWKWFYDRGAVTKRAEDGSPLLVAGIVFDITEQKKLENSIKEKNKELEELSARKNRFIGIAAHDLRGPIGGILGLVNFFKEDVSKKLGKENLVLLDDIEDSLEHTLEIINDFLNISEIESGSVNLNIEILDYIKFARKITEILKKEAKQKNIEINFACNLNNYKLEADKGKIGQVLRNFLTNAIKYSKENEKILIEIYIKEEKIITKVKDNGPGLDEEDKEKLFKAFGKTKNLPTGDEKSTGLGLYISKLIIKEHGGNIGVESQKGEGSTFYFELPIN